MVSADGCFLSACDTIAHCLSQVVAGTNYGLKYLARYTCDVDDDTSGMPRLCVSPRYCSKTMDSRTSNICSTVILMLRYEKFILALKFLQVKAGLYLP